MNPLAFPPELLALMESQFGAVARFQLRDHMSEGAVEGLVRRRVLEIVERGVYRVRGSATSPEQSAMAAVLRCRPGAVATGPLVLALLNVDGLDRSLPFEVLVAGHRRPQGVEFPWRVDPTPDQMRASFSGLPITTPTVALVDSARSLGTVTERRLRVAFDAMRWKGLTTTDRVLERARRLGPGDPGAAYFLTLFAADAAPSESEPERALGEILVGFDPAPEPQVWVTPRRRVDWYWRRFRLAIEYLGRADHGTEEGRALDGCRSDELEAAGVLVVPVVAEDLRAPDDLRAWLRLVAGRRARELGVAAPTALGA